MTADHHRANAVVFNDDIFSVMERIPSGSIHMVIGDPDYNVGINYAGKSYTTNWNQYIDWYSQLAQESLRVLRDDGNLFLINYPRQNDYLRVRYLDDAAHDVREYVWVYPTNIGHSPRKFTNAHRSILHATKCARNRSQSVQQR